MVASLSDAGHTQLGKSGTVKLTELNTSNATTRVYATYGYKRVNSNEIARDDAPEPDGTTTGSVGPDNSLAKWDGYVQWSAGDEHGTNLDNTDKSCTTITSGFSGGGSDKCQATFSVTLPAGYSGSLVDGHFDNPKVGQALWIMECPQSTQDADDAEDCSLNGWTSIDNWNNARPTTAALVAAGASRYEIGDDATFTTGTNQLDAETWYTAIVRFRWDDEDNTQSNFDTDYTQLSEPYSTVKGSHTGEELIRTGVYSDAGIAIIFKTDTAPLCVPVASGLATNANATAEMGDDPEGDCDACENYNIVSNRITIRYAGQQAAGTFLYTSSSPHTSTTACDTSAGGSLLSTSYKWVSWDGEKAHKINRGSPNNAILGSNTGNPSTNCEDVCGA